MKIAIIGAGAMGCLYACLLHPKQEVLLLDISQPAVDAINRNGILKKEPDNTESVCRVPAALSGTVHEPMDLVIVFVKDTASRAALAGNRELIGENTLLLSLQNGMGNEEVLEEFADRRQVLLGTTKHNCVTLSPGTILHSGSGMTHIGSPCGNMAAAREIEQAFSRCGIQAQACEDVKRLLWEKLFVNMTINPLTALLDAPISVLADSADVQALAYTLLTEAVAVAKADGEEFDLETIYGSLIKTADTLRVGKASMCQDLEHGRKTEIDFINGAVVKLGIRYAIPTPAHEMIVRLIHAKESLL